MREEDVYDTVISTIREIGINIYNNDINLALRIGTYKGDNVWPRPIRVELVSTHVRNVVWQNRWKLEKSMSHYNVRISKDETREVRQARAILRKSASKARSQGKIVYQHEDHILIDGQKYDLQNATQLKGKTTYAQIAREKETNAPITNEKLELKNDAKKYKLPAERKTKIGLAFFTVGSKKSCFYPARVIHEGVDYQTLEHNFQCMKALNSEMMDLYHRIKEAPTPRRAKELGGEVPFNPEWDRLSRTSCLKYS